MSHAEIAEKLLKILKGLKPNLTIDVVTDDIRLFEDLGMDSITMLLMAFKVEQEFGFRFENVGPSQLKNVGDVCSYIESRLQK